MNKNNKSISIQELFPTLTDEDIVFGRLNYDIQKLLYLEYKRLNFSKSEFAQIMGLNNSQLNKILDFEYDFSEWKLNKTIELLCKLGYKLTLADNKH